MTFLQKMQNINLNSALKFITKSSKWSDFLKESLESYSTKKWIFGDKNFQLITQIEILPTHNGDLLIETANTCYNAMPTPDHQNKDIVIDVEFAGIQYVNQHGMSNFSSVCEWKKHRQPFNDFIKKFRKALLEIATKQHKNLILEKMNKPTNTVHGFIHAGHLVVESRAISEIGAMPQHHSNTRPIIVEFYDDLDMKQIVSKQMPVRISKHDKKIKIKENFNVSILDESQKLPYVIENGSCFIDSLV